MDRAAYARGVSSAGRKPCLQKRESPPVQPPCAGAARGQSYRIGVRHVCPHQQRFRRARQRGWKSMRSHSAPWAGSAALTVSEDSSSCRAERRAQ